MAERDDDERGTPAPPERRRETPDEVEEASIESFPASDAPAWTPVAHPGPPERTERAHDPERDTEEEEE